MFEWLNGKIPKQNEATIAVTVTKITQILNGLTAQGGGVVFNIAGCDESEEASRDSDEVSPARNAIRTVASKSS